MLIRTTRESSPSHRQDSNEATTVDQRYLATAFWEWRHHMLFLPTSSESFVHMQKRTRLSQILRMQCRRNKVRMGRLERLPSQGQWSHYQDRIPMGLIYEIIE